MDGFPMLEALELVVSSLVVSIMMMGMMMSRRASVWEAVVCLRY
ncbi:MAG: hypothetical protein ANABAC_3411 [Anaerolineae bacterium]|jgi:hypothetical protein|nr:MAG: hypothetical protein ANABAC_3411 [Anaerolineae bacterium]